MVCMHVLTNFIPVVKELQIKGGAGICGWSQIKNIYASAHLQRSVSPELLKNENK